MDNFAVFTTWENESLKHLQNVIKSKVINEGEVLLEDGARADNLYFIVKGSLRIEKKVRVKNSTYWPVASYRWNENVTQEDIVFKIDVVHPYKIIAEH